MDLQALWNNTFSVSAPATNPANQSLVSTKGIAYNESRGMSRKKMNTEGKAGELGMYQITPPAWNDLVRMNPEYKSKDRYKTLTDDLLAEQALKDYLNLLVTHYAKRYKIPATEENIVQMYNIGARNFKKGVRNPAYFESYNRGKGK